MTKINKIIISVIVVIVLLGLYVAFDRMSVNKNNTMDTTATTTGVTVTTGDANYTIEQVPVSENITPVPTPYIHREVVFAQTVAPETKSILLSKIVDIQLALTKNPKDLAKWLELGLYQKSAGDYAGALISWKYVSDVSKTDYIALGNLGDLYAYYLKDNGMSEVYYKKAIARGPSQAYLYIQLSAVYRDLFKDMAKAKAIINSGLSRIPGDKSLLEAKSNLN